MLHDAPEQTVTLRQRRRLRQLPDYPHQHKRQHTQTTTKGLQPLRTRATEVPVQKPERHERMNVDDRETKKVRPEPVQRTQRQPQRNSPRPIGPRLLLGTQPDQQHQPEQKQAVPRRDNSGPRLISPPRRVIKQRQRNVSERQHAQTRKRRKKEVARLAKTNRQSHQEVTQLEPVVWTGKEEQADDRHL